MTMQTIQKTYHFIRIYIFFVFNVNFDKGTDNNPYNTNF